MWSVKFGLRGRLSEKAVSQSPTSARPEAGESVFSPRSILEARSATRLDPHSQREFYNVAEGREGEGGGNERDGRFYK